jgi:2-hydroxycyclohexanecarboxyl-CoA dehydrogenase
MGVTSANDVCQDRAMQQLLQHKVAVVTGGAGGIGGGVSRRFAEEGALVVINDIDADLAAAALKDIEGSGGRAVTLVGDVRERATIEALVDLALEAGDGRIDVLVNNVGDSRPSGPGPRTAWSLSDDFLSTTEEEWDAIYALNLQHVFRCTHAVLPHMIRQGAGAIVNVATVEAIRAFPRKPVYAAFNAGVVQFTRSLAVDVARYGVRVNAIAPDLGNTIQTPAELFLAGRDQSMIPSWTPIGRFGQPSDFADVILFLASDLARYVVGQTIPTDGGTLAAGGWYRTADGGGWTNLPDRP